MFRLQLSPRKILRSSRFLSFIIYGLYHLARSKSRFGGSSKSYKNRPIKKVVHISPCYFSEGSYIGGGERYPTSLATAMAKEVNTVLVSFGHERQTFSQEGLLIEIYPVLRLINGLVFDPLCYVFLKELISADVIHCYQYKTTVTNLAILFGAILKKRVYVSDMGGAGHHFTEKFPLSTFVDQFLHISAFASKVLPSRKSTIIYGGVDERFLKVNGSCGPQKQVDAPTVLFVGRVLPHKGINYLIESIDNSTKLDILGRPYDKDYYKLLLQLSEGKNVNFITNATDDMLIDAYKQASLTVLPSVYIDVYGVSREMPELLGLVLLESMVCGTPVICTDVGGMPEFVEDGVTGFIVPPNDSMALHDRISYLLKNPTVAAEMGRRGKEKVLQNFTWRAIAKNCLDAYKT